MLQLLGSLNRRFSFVNFLLTALATFSLLLSNTAIVATAQTAVPTTIIASSSVTSSSKVKPHATYQVTGTVFRDYNADGVQNTSASSGADQREPGYQGIIVMATDDQTSAVVGDAGSAITDANGNYTLTVNPCGACSNNVRIEFFYPNSTTGLYDTTVGTSGTSTDAFFVNGATTGLNYAVERPAQYCQDAASLNVVTTCFYQGTPSSNTGQTAVLSFKYDSSGNAATYTTLATADQVGSTFGIVGLPISGGPIHFYLTSAFYKRHTGLGPAGIGGIYLIDSNTNSVSTFTTLPAGIDPRSIGADTTHDAPSTDYLHDSNSFDKPGALSLGSMKLYTDPSTNTENVYVVDLAKDVNGNNNLYEIPINNSTNPPTPGTITAYTIPTPTCVNGVWRPFAVSPYDSKVYVGGVCDASSDNAFVAPATPDLHAYIYAFTPGSTPGTGSFNTTPVFDFPLNYTRGCSKHGPCADSTDVANGAYWHPWVNTFPSDSQFEYNGVYYFGALPQPMLSSIAFDNGNMVIGFRDRFGDQMGYNVYNTTPASTNKYQGTTAGDTLRACGNPTTGWTLEADAVCGGIANNNNGEDNGQGPSSISGNAFTIPSGSFAAAHSQGAGEYYNEDTVQSNYHDEVTVGSLLQVPGYDDVMTTAFDPTGNLYTGGVRHFYNDNTNGNAGDQNDAFQYQIYDSTTGTSPTFGKANGLGDLVALCDQAPIEIGNRIWLDTNNDGLQTPGEPALVGVTVDLYYADANGDPDLTQNGGNPLASTKTDSNGYYYFTNNPLFPTNASKGLFNTSLLTTGHNYVVILDNANDYLANGATDSLGHTGTGALWDTVNNAPYGLAKQSTGDGKNDTRYVVDNNAAAGQPPVGGYPHYVYSYLPGVNNHDLDFGFTPANFNNPNAIKGLAVSQSKLAFTASSNTANVSAQAINLSSENVAGSWKASVSYVGSNQNWLNLSQTSGTLLANNSQSIKVSANPTGLPNGTYQATISFVANSNTATTTSVNVTLTIGSIYTYYVPFVGNNANGYSSFVTLHNIGGGEAAAQIQFFDKSGNALTTTAANACSNIATDAVCSPSNPFSSARGTGIIYSNQPLSVLVAESTPFGGTAYTVPAGAASQLIAPLAIHNAGGFNTQLSVFNGSSTASQVTATFYDQQGNVLPAATKTLVVAAHSSQTLDQSAADSNLPQGFYGWVKLTGDSGSQLVAQVLEENADAKFVALLNAEATAQSKLYAPAIFKDAFGSFVTGANIVNPNNTPQQVAITYYDQSGQAYSAQTFTLAANAVQPVFQGSTSATGLSQGGLPNNFVGSAVISSVSGGGLVVAVNQAGGATANGTARSGTYLATATSSSNIIGLPVVANASNGFTSGVTVLNSSNASVDGYIQYYDTQGNAVGSQHSFTIAAHASQLAYQGADSLPSGFSGEALVVQTSGATGSLMATTNVQSGSVFYSYVEPVQ